MGEFSGGLNESRNDPSRQFPVDCEREDHRCWIARIGELPGLLAYGQTLEDAVERVQSLACEVIEAERRAAFLRECNRMYARLKSDPVAWAEEIVDREVWDSTLGDGLESE